MFSREFDNLFDLLISLPGINKKQAKKIINFLSEKTVNEKEVFITNFKNNLINLSKCKICCLYSSGELCHICDSSNRQKKLMIVENSSQIEKFEEWKLFKGKYFVVPFLFNNKSTKTNENYDFNFLIEYLDNFDELIISLSPTVEGILTSNFIFDKIKNKKPNIKISKLAIGIPMGSSLDYMDQATITYAINNRKDIQD